MSFIEKSLIFCKTIFYLFFANSFFALNYCFFLFCLIYHNSLSIFNFLLVLVKLRKKREMKNINVLVGNINTFKGAYLAKILYDAGYTVYGQDSKFRGYTPFYF